ncbi:MAG: chemotaxis protein CheW [Acidiferrobacteraceae bacterium]
MVTTSATDKNTTRLVVGLVLDGQRYALHLAQVERVIPFVQITPLPQAPKVLVGIINVQGRVIPVASIRKRFGLPERVSVLSDKIVITRTSHRRMALIVDAAIGVIEIPERQIVHAGEILPGVDYVEGVAKLEDGMILIHDLERFLGIEEEQELDSALSAAAEGGS